MNPLYGAVAERAKRCCEYCRAPEEVFNFPFKVEHIVPQSREGSNDMHNLALACHACNRFKSDFATGIDDISQEECGLFHPRRDAWQDHFRADAPTAQIIGLTPAVRATVSRLQMNREHHVAARLHWIQLGMF